MFFQNKKQLKSFVIYITLAVVFGVSIYFTMMANDLVNHYDGIWHPSNFIAGSWEVSLGRGMQVYADRARFGIVSSSWNSILCFVLIGISDIFILKKLELLGTIYSYLFIFMTIANPVISESLSYSYMSVNFALAFLFSSIAFYSLPFNKSHTLISSAIAVLSFSVSMAFYQAYIGVFAVCCISFSIKKLKQFEPIKKVLLFLLNSGIVFALGGCIYYVITKVFLYRAGISLSSYKGANQINFTNILKCFPTTFLNTYKEFYHYVVTKRLNTNLEFSMVMVLILGIVLIFFYFLHLVKILKKGKWHAALSMFLLILVPPCACVVCIIAIGNVMTGLMAMGIIITILCSYVVIEDSTIEKKVFLCFLCILAWYWTGSVENDQIALKEGTTATVTIAKEIISDINDSNMLDKVDSVAFVGRTAENPYFYQSKAFENANGYAQFGKWSTESRNNRVTWTGITNALCGISFPMCDDGLYSELIKTDTVAAMPVYPQSGYIEIIDGILVIKVSSQYDDIE